MYLYPPEYVRDELVLWEDKDYEFGVAYLAEVTIESVNVPTFKKWIAEAFFFGFSGCIGIDYTWDMGGGAFTFKFRDGLSAANAYKALVRFGEFVIQTPEPSSLHEHFRNLLIE